MCFLKRLTVLCLCATLLAMPLALLSGCSNSGGGSDDQAAPATQPSEQDNCYGDDLPALNQ